MTLEGIPIYRVNPTAGEAYEVTLVHDECSTQP